MERLKLNIQKFATSGSCTSNTISAYGVDFSVTVYWNRVSTWNDTTCGSRINWWARVNTQGPGYTRSVTGGTININGTSYNVATGSFGDGSSIASGNNFAIQHNNDGTKTFRITIDVEVGGSDWSYTFKDFTLDRIPRASKIDTFTGTDIEGTFNVEYTKYKDDFVSDLELSVGSTIIKTITNYQSGTEFTFTGDELTGVGGLYEQTNNINKNCQLTATLKTYSGTTTIGNSVVTNTCYIYNADPTFSGVTFQDTNSTTTALTGNNQIIIKGYSDAKITIPVATGNKGATIVDYVIEGVDDPITHTGSELYHTIYGCTFGTFNVYARDSRGNTKLSTVIASSTKSYEKIYLDISNSKIERWENGSESATGNEAKLTLRGTIWNNNFGSVNNAITSSEYRLKITDSSGDPVLGTTDITPTINQDGTITFSNEIRSDNPDYSWNIGDSYYIYVTVEDRLSSASITLTLNSAKPNIAIHKNGVAINGAYDTSVGGSLQIDNNLMINGKSFLDYLYPVGAIYTSVNSTSPQTLFGGTWERIKGKFLLSADEDEHWVYIASEGSSYTFTDSATIRYGAGTKWITKTVSAGTYTLNTSFFGGTDPVPGTAKTTQILIKTTAGSTSGEYYHKLVIPEMPSHNHTLLTRGGSGGSWSVSTVSSTVQASDTGMIKNAGSNASHNNMPPYLAVYMWQRTA